ncbi:MAG TPA: TIM barrel protein [Burkholderiales bacterium]|nr:TIM barrel protein [Burkholderiales bacterium]
MQSLTLAHLALGTAPEATIDAAADAGFGGVGIRICARHPRETFPGPRILGNPTAALALQERAAARGIRLSNISAYQFYPDVTWDDVAPAVESAILLGAPIIVANGFNPDLDQFVRLFSRYCRAAHEAGIRVALEFLPYSAIRDLKAALRVLERTDAANAGLLLDALHLDRSGGTPDDIRGIGAERITFAQLCDAKRWSGPRSDEALMAEARAARLPAGTGDLPLFDFLDALPAHTEIEYEVARADLANHSAGEKAHAARRDAERFMAAYAEHRRARVAQGIAQ